MIDRDRNYKKKNWPLTVAIVVWVLMACVLAISLAQRKVEGEQKAEQKYWADKNQPKPSPVFAPFGPQENEN
jgi:hypothetical protein